MYCVQNNRIYCSDCNKSFIPNTYSNHLKTKGRNNTVMKKHCCNCDFDTTHCNNHDLTCSMNYIKSEQTNEKSIDKNKNIDLDSL